MSSPWTRPSTFGTEVGEVEGKSLVDLPWEIAGTLPKKSGLDVFFAGFWDLQSPPVLRSHDS